MTQVDKDAYRHTLKAAIADYEAFIKRERELEEETDEVQGTLADLRRTITALAKLSGQSSYFDPLGITESCMEVMARETQEVSTTDVVKKLEDMGFDLPAQKNPAASVHTVLSRLAEKGKIEKGQDQSGAISWRGPKYRSPVSPLEAFGARARAEDLEF